MHGLRKISGDIRQGGQKQIPETVACEAVPRGKAVLKEISEQVFIAGKSHHAIADVAGRQNAIFAAQTAGAAAVVRDGHYGGEVGYRLGRPAFPAFRDMLLQAAQHRG